MGPPSAGDSGGLTPFNASHTAVPEISSPFSDSKPQGILNQIFLGRGKRNMTTTISMLGRWQAVWTELSKAEVLTRRWKWSFVEMTETA